MYIVSYICLREQNKTRALSHPAINILPTLIVNVPEMIRTNKLRGKRIPVNPHFRSYSVKGTLIPPLDWQQVVYFYRHMISRLSQTTCE